MTKKQVIQLINNYWKFDNDQDNLSSWHDKQDLINEIEKLTLTDVVKSFGCGWNFCNAVVDKKGVASCDKCNRYK